MSWWTLGLLALALSRPALIRLDWVLRGMRDCTPLTCYRGGCEEAGPDWNHDDYLRRCGYVKRCARGHEIVLLEAR